jgi:tetratricopeptide (TPR) repeat protein
MIRACGVLGLLLLCGGAQAQSDDIDRQRCRAFASAISIPACTAVLRRGTASTLTMAEVLRYRAAAYLHAGAPDRALADAEASARLDPQQTAPQLIHGLALYVKGDLRGALADFDGAIARDPRFAEAIYARGLVARARGDMAEARADFAAAVNIRGDVTTTIAAFGVAP